ncbi:MAG TPA: hypothetical protein VFW00_04210 [Rhodocyclaceae bacterium]|nr:hypothetical protein [Rhodocyclaceae bacterium]
MIIKLLAALLFTYSIYLGHWAMTALSALGFLATIFSLTTVYGLVASKRWAQYCWFIIAIGAPALWLLSVGHIILSGWPYASMLTSIISLLPGLFLVLICGLGSVAIYKHFRGGDALNK